MAKVEDPSEIQELKEKARNSIYEYEIGWISHPDATNINAGMSPEEIDYLENLTKQDKQTADEMQSAACKMISELADLRKASFSEIADAKLLELKKDMQERWRNMNGYERELELARLNRG